MVESKRRRSAVSVPATVDEALAAMEDPHLEFKARLSGPGKKNLRKDISAFSSCEGGVIFIGITNDGEPIGLDIEPTRGNMDKLELQLRGLAHGVNPYPALSVEVIPGKGVLFGKIVVTPGEAPVYYCDKKPYVRRGSSSEPATHEEVYRMIRRHVLEDLKG